VTTQFPPVSVVTPSLNQAAFIKATIDSVLAQNYQPIEIVIVDGQSTDGTLAILHGYGTRVRWVSGSDAGQTPAINKGFRMATGEIIGWLNADDLYLPGAVAQAVAFLKSHPAVDLVYGDADHIDEGGRVIAPYPTEPFRWQRLHETCFICQPAVFFRRRVFDVVGFLDERLNCSMDYDYWIRIAQHCAMGYIPERLAQSRLHAGAKTARFRIEHQRASIDIVKRHFDTVPASWLCAYATAVVERWVPRRTVWQKRCFAWLVTAVSIWESLRINRGVPRRALSEWIRWIRRASAAGRSR
jgi:glycosyltransferase involved in cell wall biosynthesis